MGLLLQISTILAWPMIVMLIYGFSIILYFASISHEQVSQYAQNIYLQQIEHSKTLNSAVQFSLSLGVQKKAWSIQLMNQFSLKVIEGEVVLNPDYKSIYLNTELTYINKDDPIATKLFKRNRYGVVHTRTWHHYKYLYVSEFDDLGREHLRNSTYSDLLWRLFEYDNIKNENQTRYMKFNSIYTVSEHNSMGYLSGTNTTFVKFQDPVGCTTGPNKLNGKCRYWYVDTIKEDSLILYKPDLFFSDQGNPFMASVLCQKLLRRNSTLHWVKCTSLNLQKIQLFFNNIGNFSTYSMILDPLSETVIYHSKVVQQRAVTNTLSSVELSTLQDQNEANKFREELKTHYSTWIHSKLDYIHADELMLPIYQQSFVYNRNGSEHLVICNAIVILDKVKSNNQRILQGDINSQHQDQRESDEGDLYQINDNQSSNNSTSVYLSNNQKMTKNRILNQNRKTSQRPNQKFYIENAFVLIDVLSEEMLKRFSVQMINDIEYYRKWSVVIISVIFAMLLLLYIFQAVFATHMIQYPIWHLTTFLKKINCSGDVNRFNSVNQAFSINVESYFFSEDMRILFESFKSMFQMLTFTNQSYFDNDLSTTLLNLNNQLIHFEKFKNYRALGVCHNNIANILFCFERYIEALQHYENAVVYAKLELGLFKNDSKNPELLDDKPDDIKIFQSKQELDTIINNNVKRPSENQKNPSIFQRKSSAFAQMNPKSNSYSQNNNNNNITNIVKNTNNNNNNFTNQNLDKDIKFPSTNQNINQSIGMNQNTSQINQANNHTSFNNISGLYSAQQLHNMNQSNQDSNRKFNNQFNSNKNQINQQMKEFTQVQNIVYEQTSPQLHQQQIQLQNNNNDSYIHSNLNLIEKNIQQIKNMEDHNPLIHSQSDDEQVVNYLLQQTREYDQLTQNLFHRKLNFLKCFMNFLHQKENSSSSLWEEAEILVQELIQLAKYFHKKNGRYAILYSYLSLTQIKQQKISQANESSLISKEFVMKAQEYENHYQDQFYDKCDDYQQIFSDLSNHDILDYNDLVKYFQDIPSYQNLDEGRKLLDKSQAMNNMNSINLSCQKRTNNQIGQHSSAIKLRENLNKSNQRENPNLSNLIDNISLAQQNQQDFTEYAKTNVGKSNIKKQNSQEQQFSHQRITNSSSFQKKSLSKQKSLRTDNNFLQSRQSEDQRKQNRSSPNFMQQSSISAKNPKIINILVNQRQMQYKQQKQILNIIGYHGSTLYNLDSEKNKQNSNEYQAQGQPNIGTLINLDSNHRLTIKNTTQNNIQSDVLGDLSQNQYTLNRPNNNSQNQNYSMIESKHSFKDKEQYLFHPYFKPNETILEEDNLHQDLQQSESQASSDMYGLKRLNQLQPKKQMRDLIHPQPANFSKLDQILCKSNTIDVQLSFDDHATSPLKYNLLNNLADDHPHQNIDLYQSQKVENDPFSFQHDLEHGQMKKTLSILQQNQANHLQSQQFTHRKTQHAINNQQNYMNNSVQGLSKVKKVENNKNLENYEYPSCVLSGIQTNFNSAILMSKGQFIEAALKLTNQLEANLQYLPHYNFRLVYQLYVIFERYKVTSHQLRDMLNVYTKQIILRIGVIATCSVPKFKKSCYDFCKDLYKDILKNESDSFGLISYQNQLFNQEISMIPFTTLNKNISILKRTLQQIFFSDHTQYLNLIKENKRESINVNKNEIASPFSLFSNINTINTNKNINYQSNIKPTTTTNQNNKSNNQSLSNAQNINISQASQDFKNTQNANDIKKRQNQEFNFSSQQFSSNDTSFLSLDESFTKQYNNQWQSMNTQKNNNDTPPHQTANCSPYITSNNYHNSQFNFQQNQAKKNKSQTLGNSRKTIQQQQGQQVHEDRSSPRSNSKNPQIRKNSSGIQHDYQASFMNVEDSKKTTTQSSRKSIETPLFEKSLGPQEIFHIGVKKALLNFIPTEQISYILKRKKLEEEIENNKQKFSIEKSEIEEEIPSYEDLERISEFNQQQSKNFMEDAANQSKEKMYKKYLIFITDSGNVEKNQLYYQLCHLLYQLDLELLILQLNKDDSLDEHPRHNQEIIFNKSVIQYFYSQKKLLQYLYNQRSDYQSNLLPLAVEHFQTNFLFVFIF